MNHTEMEQDPMVLPPPCPLHAFYPQKKISQGINLFGEGRRYRRKEKILQGEVTTRKHLGKNITVKIYNIQEI